MDSRWARVARGVVAASFATFVAAFSHGAAGGAAPQPFGVAASLVIAATICTLLAGPTVSLPRLTVSIGLSQLLFHALFSILGTPVGQSGHDMAAMTPVLRDAAAANIPTSLSHTAPAMLIAHIIAGAVTVLAFRYAESAFWGVAESALLLLARLLPFVVPAGCTPASAATVAVARSISPRNLALLLAPMRHRGPPLLLLAA